MDIQGTDHIDACPHCGADSDGAADAWIQGDTAPVNCPGCGHQRPAGSDPGAAAGRPAAGGHYAMRFAIVFSILVVLAIILARRFGGFEDGGGAGQLVYAILMALFVSATLASGRIWKNVQYLAIWIGIIILGLTVFSYRHELGGVGDKVMAELIPARGFNSAPDTISFPLSADGHFHIMAEVNGIPIRFMADTGASHIVLSPGDAGKLGLDSTRLTFDRFYETANGMVRGSSIRIADFRIGGIHLEEIGASVNEAAMSHSLLGMTFFNRLTSYEVKDEVLTLRWTP